MLKMAKDRKKKILHLIKKPIDRFAREFIEQNSIKSISTIVLLGDGVFSDRINASEIYMLDEHAKERGLKSEFPEINYEDVVKKIFEHERVYLW